MVEVHSFYEHPSHVLVDDYKDRKFVREFLTTADDRSLQRYSSV